MTTRRSAWRLVGTALVMSGALALSGCSGATRPGTALVVDGTTYSQAQVSEATRQLKGQGGQAKGQCGAQRCA